LELSRFIDIDESWIARDIRGLAVHLDDITPMQREIADTGVVLRRDRFEQALARASTQYGAEIRLGTQVRGLVWDGEQCIGVDAGGDRIRARYVVGADGCESHVGRWAGITRPLDLREAFTSLQYTVKSDFCNDGFLHFFAGSQTIHRGYIWVFPKADGRVSVGAGMYGCMEARPRVREYLDRFVETRLPGVGKSNLITGCAPLAVCPKELSLRNVLVVGDAARHVNPLTAGGIMNALEATDVAMSCLLAELSAGPTKRGLRGYSKRWRRGPRREQKAFALLKEVYLGMSDRELRAVLESAQRVFSSPVDRTRPFRLPLLRVLMLTRYIVPGLLRSHRMLWK
jgi:digeranylgeranylglycerophospholipid reductase